MANDYHKSGFQKTSLAPQGGNELNHRELKLDGAKGDFADPL